jgi:tetratricopeptide (TPR) repeat protein
MMTPGCPTISLFVVLAFLGTVDVAFAEPAPSTADRADALLAEGRALRSRNELEGALHAFEAADELGRSTKTALELARLQSVMGLLVEARQTLRRALASSPKDADFPPAARAEAENLAKEMERRLVSLRIEVSGLDSGDSPQISIDDQPRPISPNVAVLVNPGPHVIVAKTSSQQVSKAIDVHEGQRITISLDFEPSSGHVATEKTTDPEPSRSRPLPALANFGLGLAATGIAVGGLTGLLSLMAKNASARACANRCPPSTWSTPEPTRSTLGKVSAVSLAVGAAGAGLAFGSILLREGRKTGGKPPPVSVAVKPMRGGAAVSVNF